MDQELPAQDLLGSAGVGETAAASSRDPVVATTRLPPEPASAGAARRFVHDVLRDSFHASDIEVAALLTSELVTNAVLHAGTPVELVVRCIDGCVQVEASDTGPHAPRQLAWAAGSESGRGMAIVTALSDEWGVLPTAQGKTVWFRCHASQSPSATGDG
jgi:anti-sigma regulatory factor (Ser/Thr protein kinase)